MPTPSPDARNQGASVTPNLSPEINFLDEFSIWHTSCVYRPSSDRLSRNLPVYKPIGYETVGPFCRLVDSA